MSDKGFWTFYRRGMRQASASVKEYLTTCSECGKTDNQGLIQPAGTNQRLCTGCFDAFLTERAATSDE